MKTIDKIAQSGKNIFLAGSLAASVLLYAGCDVAPGIFDRLSAQGYYMAAENSTDLKPQQRLGLVQLGNIMQNQANYKDAKAIAQEGRSEVNIDVNVPQQEQSQQTQREIREYPGNDLKLQLAVKNKYTNQRKAIINDHVYFIGDKINNLEIIDIPWLDREVILKYDNQLYKLHVKE